MRKYYACKACGFPASISDEGVDAMRKHLKEPHDRKVRKDVYVVVRYER